MIPLKDNIPNRRFPFINVSFIVINLIIFLYQTQLPPEAVNQFILQNAVIPQLQIEGLIFLLHNPEHLGIIGGDLFWPYLTATFLHGGWMHLLGNMIYLWVFGKNIENILGPIPYLVVYLFMGAIGHFFHIFTHPASMVPLIGASGAIAGVLGAYFVLYPRALILTLVPLGFFITFIYIPAFLLLALWFLLQLFNAIMPAAPAGAQSVAWWAHIGGFISGIVIGIFMRGNLHTVTKGNH